MMRVSKKRAYKRERERERAKPSVYVCKHLLLENLTNVGIALTGNIQTPAKT